MRRPLWLDEGIAGLSPDEGAHAGCLRCGHPTLPGADLCSGCDISFYVSTADTRCSVCGDEEVLGSVREPCAKCKAVGRKSFIKTVVGKQPNQ